MTLMPTASDCGERSPNPSESRSSVPWKKHERCGLCPRTRQLWFALDRTVFGCSDESSVWPEEGPKRRSLASSGGCRIALPGGVHTHATC